MEHHKHGEHCEPEHGGRGHGMSDFERKFIRALESIALSFVRIARVLEDAPPHERIPVSMSVHFGAPEPEK